jgi:hypothetical protein
MFAIPKRLTGVVSFLALVLVAPPPMTARADEPAAASAPTVEQSSEAIPPGSKLVKIEAYPTTIELKEKFDYRQVLLTGITESGERVDVTRMATQLMSIDKAPPAEISRNGLVRAASDGAMDLTFALADQKVTVPVKISGTSSDYNASFIRDVAPTLSKLGCNAGTCHGAAQGKNGFKLSLRGYDPLFDHRALTDDLAARRFNRAAPEQSLFLLKTSGAAPHVGGVLTKPGEPTYELLKLWVAQGSKFDADSPRVAKLEVLPQNPVIPLPKMKQQMVVMATYTDGTIRDVTAEAFVESGNTEVTEANKSGIITAIRRGESAVLVRYEGAYAATTVTVMGDRSGFAWEDQPEHNYIDNLVYAKLKTMKTLPSGLCSDAEFVRRLYLDLTGLPPTAEQVRAFLADTRDARVKRDELVDQLVGGADYVEHWTNKWADLLQVNAKFLGEQGSWAFRNWIRQAVATNMPYDQFVYSVLTASGSNLENPPASYYKILRQADAVMENTTQLFLGVRFNCNKCHDHPFERWTQSQHWELAAYFAKVGRKDDPQFAGKKIGGTAVEAPVSLVEVIYDGPAGEVRHPNTNAVQKPSFPYQEEMAAPAAGGSPREQFARWATSEKNEYFAKSYVNRIWSYLLGVGFIEPVDDIRAGNPPTNPELLDRLTREFIDHDFDVQHLIKLICKSRVYQHSIATNRWNEDDQTNYSHAIARRLPAEVLYDAVYQATGSVRRLPGMPIGARAAQQRDPSVNLPDGFLDLFGRPPRESACECERSGGMLLGQALNLINGPTIAAAIADGNNEIAALVGREKDDAKLIEEIFLRVLSRPPTSREVEHATAALNAVDGAHEKLKAQLAEYEQGLPQKQREWEEHIAEFSWVPLDVSELKSAAGAEFAKEQEHAIFVSGKLEKDLYTLVANSELPNITGIRIEALADPRLPSGGPGRADNGNFVLSELKLKASPKSDPSKAEPIELQSAVADFSQEGWPVANAIDGNPGTGWAVMPSDRSSVGKSHMAAFELKSPIKFDGGAQITFTLDQQYPDGKHLLGKFRVSVTNAKPPLMLNGPPQNIAALVAVPAAQRTAEQQAELTKYYRSMDGELHRLEAAVAASAKLDVDKRLSGAQDLVWALINSPAFLFNR